MKEYELLYLKDKLNTKDLMYLENKNLDEKSILTLNLKSPKIGLILGFIFGTLAIDRFYKGDYFLGAIRLFLFLFGHGMPFIYMSIYPVPSDFTNANLAFVLWFLISTICVCVWQIADWFLVYRGIKKDNFQKILMVI